MKISAPWSPNDLVQPFSLLHLCCQRTPSSSPTSSPSKTHLEKIKRILENQVLPETPGNPADGAEELLFYVLKLDLTLEWEDSWPAPWWWIWLKIWP